MICPTCEKDKPLTPEFFHRKKTSRTGFHAVCKVCRVEEGVAYREQHPEEIRAKKKAASQTVHGKELVSAKNARWRAKYPSYLADYRKDNAEAISIQRRAHRQENPGKESARSLRWAHNNPEKRRIIWKRYYAAHPQECRKRTAAWQADHPEEVRLIARASEARKRGQKAAAEKNDLSCEQWLEIVAVFDGRCGYCGKKDKNLAQDHLTPVAEYGSYTLHNIVPACKSCNSKKNRGPVLCPVQPLLLTVAPSKPKKQRLS